MKNLTRQNPRQLIVAQELINKVKSKCCGIKAYKKLYNVILRAEKGETYNSIKNRYSLGFLEETDLGSKMEIEFQTDSFEILSKQLIEYGSGIEIVQPDELKCITRKHLAQITNHCLNLI